MLRSYRAPRRELYNKFFILKFYNELFFFLKISKSWLIDATARWRSYLFFSLVPAALCFGDWSNFTNISILFARRHPSRSNRYIWTISILDYFSVKAKLMYS